LRTIYVYRRKEEIVARKFHERATKVRNHAAAAN